MFVSFYLLVYVAGDRLKLTNIKYWDNVKKADMKRDLPTTFPHFWVEATMRRMNKNVLVPLLKPHLERICAIANKEAENMLTNDDVSGMARDAILQLFVKVEGAQTLKAEREERTRLAARMKAVVESCGKEANAAINRGTNATGAAVVLVDGEELGLVAESESEGEEEG